MNGRLQGFLSFLDLLAEGRRFEAPTGLAPVLAGNVVKFPLTGHQKPRLFQGGQQPRVTTRH